MKNITIKLIYIILAGAVNFGICSTPWIPNKILYLILAMTFTALTLLAIYLIVKVIKESHKLLLEKYALKKSYIFSSFISLILVGLFVFVNLINFLIILFSGTYVNDYIFDGKKFYIYDTSFMDSMTNISVKMDYLPIRKEVVELSSPSDDMMLYRDKNMIYFMFGDERHNLYDLNTSSIVIVWC